ncbi:hypothetical protein [Streptomyces purpureus]|uniref:Uncharacterized protein n=1 Tax=Streptomyces purpureus TaxID=1951 RepID=A0A918H6M5_9ACTN|nr:hypothetical protein [Streptomyces purpureus]GGT37143.1 hypothetical protein GCM10014713_33620 [Streptomyces purpureus]
MTEHDREAHACFVDLRAALAEHGITLPSLGVDLVTYAARSDGPPLIALGNCNVTTARRLVDVLRKAAER